MLMPELTAKADDVFSLQPRGVVTQGEILAVPYATASVLRVDVHRHEAIGGTFGKDLHCRCRSRNLRERRDRLPLPPVPQEVEVTFRGHVGTKVAGRAERKVSGLRWQRARGHRA